MKKHQLRKLGFDLVIGVGSLVILACLMFAIFCALVRR